MNSFDKAKMKDLHPVISECIRDGGQFVFYPTGTSMLPTIVPCEDCVILVEADKIKKNDLVLFVRTNGTYVLHRIIGEKCGEYIIMGDNQTWTERIVPSQVIAKVAEIRKKDGKILTFSEFSSVTTMTSLFFHKSVMRVKNKIKRILKGNK